MLVFYKKGFLFENHTAPSPNLHEHSHLILLHVWTILRINDLLKKNWILCLYLRYTQCLSPHLSAVRRKACQEDSLGCFASPHQVSASYQALG